MVGQESILNSPTGRADNKIEQVTKGKFSPSEPEFTNDDIDKENKQHNLQQTNEPSSFSQQQQLLQMHDNQADLQI